MTAILKRHRALLLVVVVAAVLPVASSRLIFPYGTQDLDEVGYLSQARALQAGDLTLPRATYDPFFRPFLSGTNGDRIVFKYQPAWPAALAVSRAITGSFRPALALFGVIAAVGMYAFAYELFRRRAIAFASSAAFVVSPFVIVQSATYLAYSASLGVLLLAGAALLRGTRRPGAGWYLCGGALLGLAFFHRSFDAVLWAAPLLGYVLWRSPTARARVRAVALTAGGALPLGVLYLAYNAAVMGSPTTPAFTSSGSIDTFGFGKRASFEVPGHRPHAIDFTPSLAWRAVQSCGASLGSFAFGGLVGIAFAVAGLWVLRRRTELALLLAIGLVFPAGYFFWWGTPNAIGFRLQKTLGPFYWYPVMVPLVILTVLGGERAYRALRRAVPSVAPVASVAVVAALCVVPTWRLTPVLRHSKDLRRSQHLVPPAGAARSLLLASPKYSDDPYVRQVVPGSLRRERHLIGLAVNGQRLIPLLARMPDRAAFQQRELHTFNGLFHTSELVIVPLRTRRVDALRVQLTLRPSTAYASGVAYVRLADGTTTSVPLGRVDAGRTRAIALTVTRATGPAPPGTVHLRGTRSTIAQVGVRLGQRPASSDGSRFELRYEVAPVAGSTRLLDVLTPAIPWHLYQFPNGQSSWAAEDISPLLQQQVR